ncbi:MAG: HD-GYP domain-containing protein [Planctomycetota bacterium]
MSGIRPHDLQRVSDLVEALDVLVKNYQIYGLAHPRTRRAADEYRRCAEVVRQLPGGSGDELVVRLHDDRFFLQRMPLPDRPHTARAILDIMKANGKSSFLLSLRPSEEEVFGQVEFLLGKTETSSTFRWLTRDEFVERQGSSSGQNARANLLLGLDDLKVDHALCGRLLTTLSTFMSESTTEEAGNVAPLLEAGDELVEKFGVGANSILPVTTVPYYDNFTYHHSINVAVLAMSVAQHLVESKEQLRRVCQAALLHDLGKARVPNEILFKPGRLDAAELKCIEEHPVAGARMLARLPGMDPLAVSIAFGHHIKDNGRGYPQVSSGFRLSPVTRLIEVVDIFEALTAHRPYKKSLTATQAFEILYSMPDMESFKPYMDLLIRSIGYNPVGSRVKIATGEIGVVVGHKENDPLQPLVKPIRRRPDSTPYLETEAIAGVASVSSSPRSGLGESGVVALDPEEDEELVAAFGR